MDKLDVLRLQLYMDQMNDFEYYIMSHVILGNKQIKCLFKILHAIRNIYCF
jgi:hypothetical protein